MQLCTECLPRGRTTVSIMASERRVRLSRMARALSMTSDIASATSFGPVKCNMMTLSLDDRMRNLMA
ncbi:hypothetical protein F751_4712 [Auxenochlorella protothecoides]|uniref:Uncharacterized protein n=1 Tax=Auxenochlorella protothecoides TaxID=3075 RepID=A0A087SKG5_AUXPR|nr:hypothetical protein F751_4712 [Auxenochlorella protothecoides]KFM26219.1 hypothetical protein F751_4712 [Auxenochlorella protothecoides]